MPRLQPIQPARPKRSVENDGNDSRGTRRQRHTQKEWDDMKDLILQLFHQHPLDTTIRIVEERTGFRAGRRQYKNKLSEWGSNKNIEQGHMNFIAAVTRERATSGKKTAIIYKGAKVEDEAIRKFEARRPQDVDSPSSYEHKVTPDGIMYFTPSDFPQNTQTASFTPGGVFTPLSRLPGTWLAKVNALREFPDIAALLSFDELHKKLLILKVVNRSEIDAQESRSRRRRRSPPSLEDASKEQADYLDRRKALAREKLPNDLERHTHYHCDSCVVGSGRFSQESVLQDWLWQAGNLRADLLANLTDLHMDTSDTTNMSASSLPATARRASPPHYLITVGSGILSKSLSSFAIQYVKHNMMIRKLIGLSKADISRWVSPWDAMVDHDMDTLSLLCDHVFGKAVPDASNRNLMTLTVHFNLANQGRTPLILRLSLIRRPAEIREHCHGCDGDLLTLDYLGSEGAIKVTYALGTGNRSTWASLAEFRLSYGIKPVPCFTTLSKLSLNSGGSYIEHVRRCYCDGAVHRNGFRPHYINMEDEEQARTEAWNTEPPIKPNDEFNPCPDGDNYFVVENALTEDEISEGEHWDPNGLENLSLDCFDAYPSDDEVESHYLTKPHFIRFRPAIK